MDSVRIGSLLGTTMVVAKSMDQQRYYTAHKQCMDTT